MIMLRHSDSSTEDASLKDHDRPLTAWGRTQASELCRNLIDRGWANPDLVLCSASQRSRETLRELAKVHPDHLNSRALEPLNLNRICIP